MQLFVTPAEQPYLRFLWKDENQDIITYQYPRHILEQPTLLRPSKDSHNTDAMEAKKFQTPRKADIAQRKLLKIASSPFDPLELAMPMTISLRQNLQLAWKSGPLWDKALDLTILSNLSDWLDEIENFNNVKLPRTYFRPQRKATDIQLHVFSDASKHANSRICN